MAHAKCPKLSEAIIGTAVQQMPQDVEALWATRSKAEEMQREQKAAWQQRAARAETLRNQVCVSDLVFSAPSMILFTATCPWEVHCSASLAVFLWAMNACHRKDVVFRATQAKLVADTWTSVWDGVEQEMERAKGAAPSSGRQVTVEDRLFGECVVLGRLSEDWLSKSPRL